MSTEPPESTPSAAPAADPESAEATPAAVAADSPDLEHVLASAELPDEEVFERTSAKPPRYRLVRGAMYTIYMLVVSWFCISVTVAVWQSVWGPGGQVLRANDAKAGGAANLNCKRN